MQSYAKKSLLALSARRAPVSPRACVELAHNFMVYAYSPKHQAVGLLLPPPERSLTHSKLPKVVANLFNEGLYVVRSRTRLLNVRYKPLRNWGVGCLILLD